MKSFELYNGENRIALRQLLQNRKLRHWWRHNLGSRWKLQKMARENFSIRAFYNITRNQDNPIKTVGRDSFLSPKTPKNTTLHKQTNRHYENNGHLAVNQSKKKHATLLRSCYSILIAVSILWVWTSSFLILDYGSLYCVHQCIHAYQCHFVS